MPATTRRASELVRENVLDAAYELFNQRGTRAVGVDAIIARAGVAKATFYHHFSIVFAGYGERTSARLAREAGALLMEAQLAR
jgi:AcrR family transcriptional regulator